ncbi:zinc finger HIT domain-containing protein 3-like [Saccostrea echinata]|uniref:zinc finger HIT domain-containing protein 3-like n=1 Tax=Saccostrea echinata TaxID=191078 RepID=UPI002A807321|nr:zinc finger HIT domain-containing protein 3-like [Saccostrea echinata]
MEGKEKHQCEVCQTNVSKYKCPKCIIKYCSVSCFKLHKESVCKPMLTQSQNKEPRVTAESKTVPKKIPDLDLEETDDRVSPETLQCLRENPDLLLSLENPHLRTLMTDLVTSPLPSQDMEKVMKEPIFLEFADQCLKVVDNNHQTKSPEG